MAIAAADVKAALTQIENLLGLQPDNELDAGAAAQTAYTSLAANITNFADAPTATQLGRVLVKAAYATPGEVPIEVPLPS
jgi:hypothetical protein